MANHLAKNASRGMTIPHVAEYLNQANRAALVKRGRPLAKSTVRAIRARLASATVRVPDHDLPGALSERARVNALLDALYQDLTIGSVRNIVRDTLNYGEFLVARGDIERCYLLGADVPNVPLRRAVDVYSEEDVELLLLAAEMVHPRLHLAMLTLVDTGCRVSEMLNLTYDALNLDASPPHFLLPTSKSGVPRLVVISPRLHRAWREVNVSALKSGEAELDRARRRQRRRYQRDQLLYCFPWSYPGWAELLQRLCADAEVEHRGSHRFRHTAATRWLSEGADILAVSRLLGHSQVATTAQVYSHVTALDYGSVLGWKEDDSEG